MLPWTPSIFPLSSCSSSFRSFQINIFCLQINPEKSKEEFRSASQNGGGTGVKDLMDSMGLGMLGDQVHILSNTIYSGILSNIL